VAASLGSTEKDVKEITEIGEWSDVIQVQTLDNQKINNESVNEEFVARFYQNDGA
jgi:hypothetical protein